MSYFSRLTDIVTCNLTELLAQADDPAAALDEIIAEMEEGLAGAERCVTRATRSERELTDELRDYREQAAAWVERAKTALGANDEDAAREALLRKGELEDLIAGLEREHDAAVSTRESLATTLRALEARLSDARRRQQQLSDPGSAPDDADTIVEHSSVAEIESSIEASRSEQIETELAELRKQLGQS